MNRRYSICKMRSRRFRFMANFIHSQRSISQPLVVWRMLNQMAHITTTSMVSCSILITNWRFLLNNWNIIKILMLELKPFTPTSNGQNYPIMKQELLTHRIVGGPTCSEVEKYLFLLFATRNYETTTCSRKQQVRRYYLAGQHSSHGSWIHPQS